MKKTYEITRRHRLDNLSRLLCCCMVVMILFGSVLSPPPANAFAITAGTVAITMLVLAASGITFNYASKSGAINGISSMLAKFFDMNPDVEEGEMFGDWERGAVTLGTIGRSAVQQWNRFIDWVTTDNPTGLEYYYDGKVYPVAEGDMVVGGTYVYGSSASMNDRHIKYPVVLNEPTAVFKEYPAFTATVVKDGDLYRVEYRMDGELIQTVNGIKYDYYRYIVTDSKHTFGVSFESKTPPIAVGGHITINKTSNGGNSNQFKDEIRAWYEGEIGIETTTTITVPQTGLIPFPEVDEDTDPLIITLPESLWDVTKTLDDNLDTIITDVGTGAVAVPKISEMTQTGTQTDTLDEGINWDILTKLEVFNKFPFSIPTDVYLLVNALVETPVEPRWEFDLVPQSLKDNVAEDGGKVVLEFSSFEGIRQLLRTCLLILFLFGLMLTTKNMIWTGGG